MDWFATFLMTKFLLYAALFSRTYFNKVIVILLQVAKSFVMVQIFCDGPIFFLLDQKSIYMFCQSQTFCARQKEDLLSVKLVVFEEALNAV